MNWESFFYGFVSGFMLLFLVVMATRTWGRATSSGVRNAEENHA